MATKVMIRKWGSSVGVVFPKELVEKKHLKVNEKVIVEVVREADLKDLFGSLKRKMTGQEFKDMVRKGWS